MKKRRKKLKHHGSKLNLPDSYFNYNNNNNSSLTRKSSFSSRPSLNQNCSSTNLSLRNEYTDTK